jgi:hypothetical protein
MRLHRILAVLVTALALALPGAVVIAPAAHAVETGSLQIHLNALTEPDDAFPDALNANTFCQLDSAMAADVAQDVHATVEIDTGDGAGWQPAPDGDVISTAMGEIAYDVSWMRGTFDVVKFRIVAETQLVHVGRPEGLVDAECQGTTSNVISADLTTSTPPPPPPPAPSVHRPSAPTSVHGYGRVRRAVLTWRAPARNGGARITGYRVRAASGTLRARVLTLGPAKRRVTITSLRGGRTYTLSVRAKNRIGWGPAKSVRVRVKRASGGGGGGSTPPPPPPPTSVKDYANCDAMHRDYPHGVGLPGARDRTSGTPVTNFRVSGPLYRANDESDADKDGIACEKR